MKTLAWALWCRPLKCWVPVNDRPNIPKLYPNRRAARAAQLPSRETLVRVEIRKARV